jgi:hypothetical protein
MSYRKFVAAACVVAASLSVSPAVYAATSVHAPVHAMFSKTKTVKIMITNDTSSPMELKAGDQTITVDAKKTTTVSLTEGTRIVCNSSTPSHEAGSLIAEVTSQLSGATIHIK